MDVDPLHSPVRIGVVGCGGSRQTYGPALAALSSRSAATSKAEPRQVLVTALLDVDILAARLWAKKIRGAQAYGDFDEFLANAPVDAVIVATPPGIREGQTAALLSAGKHVLSEVPFATQAAASLGLARQARRLGLHLWPSMLLRFDDIVNQAFRQLTTGVIGQVRELRCEWAYSAAWSERKAILQTWSGALLRHAVRSLDLARWWLGEAHAVSADIDPSVPGMSRGFHANVIVQHDAGVSVHHIHRTNRHARFERYIATGSTGVLELTSPAAGAIDGASVFRLTIRRPETPQHASVPQPIDATAERVTAYHSLVAGFVSVVAGGVMAPPWPSAADAASAQAVLEAALVSSQEGLKVTVAPLATAAIDPAG